MSRRRNGETCVSILEPAKRASALILLMDALARRVRMTAWGDLIMDMGGAETSLAITRDYFAPEAGDSVYQEDVRLLQFNRADLITDVYLVEFDVLRRKAESKMQKGRALPGALVSVLHMQNAALSGSEKCTTKFGLPSCRETAAEIIRPMRRGSSTGRFGSGGGGCVLGR